MSGEVAKQIHIDETIARSVAAGTANGQRTGIRFVSAIAGTKDAAVKAIDPNDPLYGQKVEGALKAWRENASSRRAG